MTKEVKCFHENKERERDLSENGVYAQGNLEVTFEAKSAKSTDDHPQKAEVLNLWCQARKSGVGLLPIKNAYFVRYSNREIIPAVVNNTRAKLVLGLIPITSIGRYRCDIKTIDGHHAWGWSFINMRPVFHSNRTKAFEIFDDDRFHLKAPSIRATEGETVLLDCPVIGFPEPSIKWYKDDVPVASTEQITFLDKSLQITKIEFDDEGTYSCIAQNTFYDHSGPDSVQNTYQSRLDRDLRVISSYRWMYPLIVIAIIILLLFIIIYLCSIFSRYKTYNVEKWERRKNLNGKYRKSENSSQHEPILGNEIRS
ncbi:unnamed protein product [Dracunculus medinensis]|uniref:Ig-like domain-containing protein n=1 Tax=Dracunculus medinensis TaxID=318479 RepID=A0A0N4UML4_DRAME|nr:unnamed protein product [Dracunculus medinensis]